MSDEMTVEEAAVVLGVTPAAVRKRIERGQMKARRVGARLLLISGEEMERWRPMGKLRPGPKPGTTRKAKPAGE